MSWKHKKRYFNTDGDEHTRMAILLRNGKHVDPLPEANIKVSKAFNVFCIEDFVFCKRFRIYKCEYDPLDVEVPFYISSYREKHNLVDKNTVYKTAMWITHNAFIKYFIELEIE